MAKHPESPMVIAREFTEEVKAIFGEELVAVILYGSAAGATWQPKKSDINLLIVLSEVAIGGLNAAFPLIEKWHKRLRALPVFMTRQYIEASLDSFPIEFLHMQRRHVTLYGEDVLAPLQIAHANLRLQCEEQIKGKLLHLRGAYLTTLGKRHRLQQFFTLTLAPFAILFRALLVLKGAEVPDEPGAILLRTAELYDLDVDLFQQLLQAGDRKSKLSHVELNHIAASYIDQVNKLARIVDQME